jgi:hypothetical protein
LIARGWSVNLSRKSVIVAGVILMSAGVLAATARTAAVAPPANFGGSKGTKLICKIIWI